MDNNWNGIDDRFELGWCDGSAMTSCALPSIDFGWPNPVGLADGWDLATVDELPFFADTAALFPSDLGGYGWVPATAGIPCDSIVDDVLTGAGSTGQLIDGILGGQLPDGGPSVTVGSEIGGTLDFLNGDMSMISGMIGDLEAGRGFSESEFLWANTKIDSAGYNAFWDAINHDNDVSNDLRRDQLDDQHEEQQRRAEYDLWQEGREAQEVIDAGWSLYQENQRD